MADFTGHRRASCLAHYDPVATSKRGTEAHATTANHQIEGLTN